MTRARVYFRDKFAGWLEKSNAGYSFEYDHDYLNGSDPIPISLTMPLQSDKFTSREMFAFFRNLIPEGWLFELNARALNIDPADDFGMLLATGRDCIGAVSVVPEGGPA